MLNSLKPLLSRTGGSRLAFTTNRSLTRLVLTSLLFISSLYVFSQATGRASTISNSVSQDELDILAAPTFDQRVHLLILATDQNENICKLLMSSNILGYTTPVLIAWGHEKKIGANHGGTHALKLSKVNEYLQSINSKQENDLVLFVDGYDIQFQLPLQTLLERYGYVVKDSNKRLATELGEAFQKEGIRNTIFFGAEKKRWPNQLFEVASYTAPESPLPADLYGEFTDTPISFKGATSRRQRFLNSGFIIGPLRDMKKLFNRALARADDVLAVEDSDQRIFNTVMGEQSFWRETMRLKHVPWSRRILGNKPKDSWVESYHIDNILDPSFRHEKFELNPLQNYEFGISLDYFSNFTHQTEASPVGRDSAWIIHADAVSEIEAMQPRRTDQDCRIRMPVQLPDDVSSLQRPFSILEHEGVSNISSEVLRALSEKSWSDVPLYTQLCVGSIPVMVHHNGNKTARRGTWQNMWYQDHAKDLIRARMAESAHRHNDDAPDWTAFRESPNVIKAGGAWSSDGKWLDWSDVCPASIYGKELYRSNDPTDWV